VTSTDRSTHLAKVRKLLALATGSAGGEEARTAAVVACKLIVEHRLLDQVQAPTPEPSPVWAPPRPAPSPPTPTAAEPSTPPFRRRVVTIQDKALRRKQIRILRYLAESAHPRADVFREMLSRMQEFDDRLLTERQQAWAQDAYRAMKADEKADEGDS